MPYRDGTGPAGMGPRTGRGLGPCGRGFARRSGFRAQNYTKEEEITELRAEKEAIEARLKELEKKKE
jgi:adenylosuccinate synthase